MVGGKRKIGFCPLTSVFSSLNGTLEKLCYTFPSFSFGFYIVLVLTHYWLLKLQREQHRMERTKQQQKSCCFSSSFSLLLCVFCLSTATFICTSEYIYKYICVYFLLWRFKMQHSSMVLLLTILLRSVKFKQNRTKTLYNWKLNNWKGKFLILYGFGKTFSSLQFCT